MCDLLGFVLTILTYIYMYYTTFALSFTIHFVIHLLYTARVYRMNTPVMHCMVYTPNYCYTQHCKTSSIHQLYLCYPMCIL